MIYYVSSAEPLIKEERGVKRHGCRREGRTAMRRLALAGGVISAAVTLGPCALGQTLEEELYSALLKHPAIEAVRDDFKVSDARIGEAFADYLPSVSVDADGGYEYTDGPARRRRDNRESKSFRRRATATANQLVFDGFRREGNFETARLNRQIAEYNVDDTIQQILLRGTEAYHNVLRTSRLVELADGNVGAIRRRLNLETERVERGAGLRVDELLAKTRLQIARERVVLFQGRVVDATAQYIEVFDRPPTLTSMQEPIPPLELLPPDTETAVQIAIGGNPAVLARDREVDVADQQRTISRSDFFPKIEVVGTANYENDFDGIIGERRDFSVVLQITWQIFSGLARPSRVSQAASAYASSLSRLSFAKRQAAERTRLAFNELLNARDRVTLLENAVDLARETFNARVRLRAAGRDTAINVLDAERELFIARINLTDALYDARIAAYRVLAATGQLTPENLRLYR